MSTVLVVPYNMFSPDNYNQIKWKMFANTLVKTNYGTFFWEVKITDIILNKDTITTKLKKVFLKT